MEKIPAACAMDWSIELEKGLRSKRPAQAIEVIEQIGKKLQKWTKEQNITLQVSKMFGLVPGEDRVFANAILLRLADSFRTGNTELRLSILKVFQLELKEIMKNGRYYNGILSKERVPNHVEMLKRVKSVFDTGDVEARALSLCLLGCWASLTKDNPDVRHMVLTSLQSQHNLEVKASLFAAGCMCMLSEDFSCIILYLVVHILRSKALIDVKIAAARAFGRMQSSSSMISKGYEVGKKLISDYQLGDAAGELLLSLSKLAFKSILLVSDQVKFLMSFFKCECTPSIKVMALRCLSFLLMERRHFISDSWAVMDFLVNKIDDASVPLSLQCRILSILRKIFRSPFRHPPSLNEPELLRLVSIVETIANSSSLLRRSLAFGLLVDITCSLKNSNLEVSSVACFLTDLSQNPAKVPRTGSINFAHHVADLLINKVASQEKDGKAAFHGFAFGKILRSCNNTAVMKQECKILSSLLFCLIEEYPELCIAVLSKINSLLQSMNSHKDSFDEDASSPEEGDSKSIDVGKDHPFSKSVKKFNNSVIMYFILFACRTVNVCLGILDHISGITLEVYHKVNLITECIKKSRFSDFVAFETFSLHLQCCIICHSNGIMIKTDHNGSDSTVISRLGSSDDTGWTNHEYKSLRFAKEMLKGRNSWSMYKVGKFSACEGLWLAATFSFRKLLDNVVSSACISWLRSLMLLAGAESEIKLLLFPNLSMPLISWLHSDNGNEAVFKDGHELIRNDLEIADFGGQLNKIFHRICSSKATLAAGASQDIFIFQRWFLRLRASVIENLVHICGILRLYMYNKQNYVGDGSPEQSTDLRVSESGKRVDDVVSHLGHVSIQLLGLAKEYDLLATSFMDIDQSSLEVVSRLALGCSLLAFCILSPFYSVTPSVVEDEVALGLQFVTKPFNILAQDLSERLLDIDNQSAVDLQKIIAASGEFLDKPQSKTHLYKSSHIDKATVMLTRFALLRLQHFHSRREGIEGANENIPENIQDRLQSVSDIVKKWIALPFQTPKRYFSPRPSFAVELFVFSADLKDLTEISNSAGSVLSVNFCVQLKNTPLDTFSKIAKFYCILGSRPSDRFDDSKTEKQENACFLGWETDVMVDLNEQLLRFVESEKCGTLAGTNEIVGSNDWAATCVCLNLNEKGQGFSTCLLDVSSFPPGKYRIRWHSCCINNNGSCWSFPPANEVSFNIMEPHDTT